MLKYNCNWNVSTFPSRGLKSPVAIVSFVFVFSWYIHVLSYIMDILLEMSLYLYYVWHRCRVCYDHSVTKHHVEIQLQLECSYLCHSVAIARLSPVAIVTFVYVYYLTMCVFCSHYHTIFMFCLFYLTVGKLL